MTAPTMRCTYYPPGNGPRCEADATHRLLGEDGRRGPGGVYCLEHATEIVDEYREKLGWHWTTQTLEEATDDNE